MKAGAPTDSRVAAGFLDVLFGVFAAYCVTKIPVEISANRPWAQVLAFYLLALWVILRLALHWWATRLDLAVLGALSDGRVSIGHYLLSVLVGSQYVVLMNLLSSWWEARISTAGPLRFFFALVAGVRVADFVLCERSTGVLLPQQELHQGTESHTIAGWYRRRLKRSFGIGLLSIVPAVWILAAPQTPALRIVAVYLVVEIAVELRLYRTRADLSNRLFSRIETTPSPLDTQAPPIRSESASKGTLLRSVYIFVVSLTLAYLEVQIEGPHGWASNLPTWRIAGPGSTILFGGRPITGYHVALNTLLLLLFHWPFLFRAWEWRTELRVLQGFVVTSFVWDFLWFVINPNFGLGRWNAVSVWWYPHWFLGLPLDYYCGVVIALLLRAAPALLGKETLRSALRESFLGVATPIALAAAFAVLWKVVGIRLPRL